MPTKTIKLDTFDIDNLIKKLTLLKKDMEKTSNIVTKKVAEQGLAKLNEYYSTTPQTPNTSDIKTSFEKTQTGYRISSRGQDVVYVEFGTGDEGEKSPEKHPYHGKYGLKEHNSGKYIRRVNPNNKRLQEEGIIEGKYWTYVRDGELHYTQGLPVGLQVFNTINDLRNDIIPKILKEEIGDVLSKL